MLLAACAAPDEVGGADAPVTLPAAVVLDFPNGEIPFGDRESARLTRAWGPLWDAMHPDHPKMTAAIGALAPGSVLAAQTDAIAAALGPDWARVAPDADVPGGEALVFARGPDRIAIVAVPAKQSGLPQPLMVLTSVSVVGVN